MKSLVLSGGGAKGAYQCGALQHLLGELEIKYDILCGVSVGAINCAFLSMFQHGEEKVCANELKTLWDNLDTKKIYKRHFPFGRWHALWKSSFYDSSPLINLIHKEINLDKIRASGKLVSVGAVSLSSGKYTVFNQNHDSFVDAVIASASFPGMLCPIKIDNQWWGDGGIKEITPVKVAIELGATEVDIIMTSPETRIKQFIERPNALDIIKRSIDLSADKIMSNDIEKVFIYNKLAEKGDPDRKVIKLNIIRPKHNLTQDLLDFDPIKMKKMKELGHQDAKTKYGI